MQRSFKPRPTLDSQNTRNLYADIAWFGVLSGISGSFLSVFILRVGGSDFHVGLLSALPALVTFLASIPGSRLVEHENKPQSVLIVTAVLGRLGYLAIALSPFFLTAKRADVMVAIVGFMTVPTAVFNVAFTTMFGQAVKPHLSSFFFHWGGFFAIPLYSIYWVRVLKATDGWVGLLSMVGSATTIVFYPLWESVAEFGPRDVLGCCVSRFPVPIGRGDPVR